MLTLLKNCLLTDSRKVNILIKDKIIMKISETEITEEIIGEKINWVFDIKNNLVMPGIIDAFSRIYANSPYTRSNYESESIAAAYGGITTFIDYEIKNISNSYFDFLTEKLFKANDTSLVNFGFFVSASELIKTKELLKIQEYSVGTILNLTNSNIRDHISNYSELLDYIDSSKLILLHLSGDNIDNFFKYCKDKRPKLLFYDITNVGDLDKIISYRNQGYNIRTSTSVNYLLLNKDLLKNDYARKSLLIDYSLGNMTDNIHLWNAIKENKIDIITSNHSPITLMDKFEIGTPGLPGFETMFSLLYNSFFYKKIPISILERLLCINPSSILGINNKGKLEEGYDADIIVINITKRWWIKNEDIVSSSKWTQFNDHKVLGRVMMTFINGNLVFNWLNQMKPIRNNIKGQMIQFNLDIFFDENIKYKRTFDKNKKPEIDYSR